ncbi:hypothetical protein TEPIDINF_001250 [Tepidibacillus infernus]|nr:MULTISPECIES: hypothetical protein [Tepidibacillus]GBF11107.1 hypothetical protein HK1_01125 [Tepidibacillus sp. HK-1]
MDKKISPKEKEPTIAPSMEMDALDEDATPEEVKKGKYTRVVKLVSDRR